MYVVRISKTLLFRDKTTTYLKIHMCVSNWFKTDTKKYVIATLLWTPFNYVCQSYSVRLYVLNNMLSKEIHGTIKCGMTLKNFILNNEL